MATSSQALETARAPARTMITPENTLIAAAFTGSASRLRGL
jgi:hypothetical protein